MGADLTIQNAQWSTPTDRKELSALDIAIETSGFRKRFQTNAEIYGVGERAHYFYKVVRGCIRSYTVVEDGRRLIAAFYLPGDIFGFQPTERHLFAAEAVNDVEILVVNRNEVTGLAARENAVAGALWAHVANELHRTQGHLLLLNKAASERVVTFLLEMDDRLQLSDENGLPMCRQDIADYLGLCSETVSRQLTKLEDTSAIAMRTTRHIVLSNRDRLEQMVT